MTAPAQSEEAVTLTAEQRMLILKAIGDPRRMEILERLSQSPTACSNFRDCMSISPATLSHHLKELESAGLIVIRREGKFAHLTLRRNIWQAFLADLQKI